jgi:hypothetical protein
VNLNLFYAWRKIQVALQEVDFLGWIWPIGMAIW